MQFSTIFATVLSLAVLAAAAPIAVEERQVAATQNHGMCVASVGGVASEIVGC